MRNHIPSHTLIAYAVLMDNGMEDTLTCQEMSAWLDMASDIEDLMSRSDEPRFTMYDYLDACVNGTKPWKELAETLRKAVRYGDPAGQDAAFAGIIGLAEAKRRTYSGDFS